MSTVSEGEAQGVSDGREYEIEENKRLDKALTEAIEAAEEAGEGKLATLLRQERGSHYHKSRISRD